MNGQLTSSRNWERMVGAAIVGVALATLFCKADGAAHGWNLFDGTAWVVLEEFRPVILAGLEFVKTLFVSIDQIFQYMILIVTYIGYIVRVRGVLEIVG